LLALRDVSVRLIDPETGIAVNALDRVFMEVEKGEAVVLVGESGAGKTTLLSVAAGLIRVTTGRVWVAGRELTWGDRKQERWLRAKVGVAFQFPERSFFATTVREEIGFTASLLGWEPERVKAAVERALSAVGLRFDLLDRSPFTLSGGEKRRVALAAALAHEPELLLLDEPEVGMDVRGQKRIRELIQRLKSEGKALVVATHDVDAAMAWADRCVVLERGRVVDALAFTDPWPEAASARLAPYSWDYTLLRRIYREANARGWTLPDPHRARDRFLAALTAWAKSPVAPGEAGNLPKLTEGPR